MTRRFGPGERFDVGGLELATDRGAKGPEDVVLRYWLGGHWRSVPMAVPFCFHDFFAENEDYLYPPGQGHEGARKYTRGLDLTHAYGWRTAVEILEDEKARARR